MQNKKMSLLKETEFPCYYIDSDIASKKAQNIYKGFTWVSLSCMLLTTILVSLSSSVARYIPWFEKTNGIILFLSGLISIYLVISKPEKGWYLGRAIAESIKTLSWRYMMHASPFESGDNNEDVKQFAERISDINKQANKDKFIPKPNKNHSDVITPKMGEVNNLNFDERKSFYLKNRIADQIKWYGDKSELNRKKGNIYSWLMVGFQFIGGIYLFFFIDDFKLLNINNIMVFLATSIIAVVEMNKYKELHQSYAFTCKELNIIKTKASIVNNDIDFQQFVIEAEQAISREHTMWLARRGGLD